MVGEEEREEGKEQVHWIDSLSSFPGCAFPESQNSRSRKALKSYI